MARSFKVKGMAWLAASAGMVVWGLSGAIAGCGGDESAATIGDPDAAADGAAASSSSTSSSGGSSSSSGGSSSGGSTDGGVNEGGVNDGGTSGSTNPNKVTCGGAECAAPAQACCTSFQFDGGSTSTCQPAGNACQGVKAECDEKADCPGQEVCCSDFGGGLTFACAADCKGQNVQVCKTASECGAGGTCTEYTCPGGTKLRACEKPAACN